MATAKQKEGFKEFLRWRKKELLKPEKVSSNFFRSVFRFLLRKVPEPARRQCTCIISVTDAAWAKNVAPDALFHVCQIHSLQFRIPFGFYSEADVKEFE